MQVRLHGSAGQGLKSSLRAENPGSPVSLRINPPKQPEHRATQADRQRRAKHLLPQMKLVASISPERFIRAISGKRNRDMLARQLTDPVGRDARAIGIRLVVHACQQVNQPVVVTHDPIREVPGVVTVRHLLCEPRFIEGGVVKRDRARVDRLRSIFRPSSPPRRSNPRRPTRTPREEPPRSFSASRTPAAAGQAHRMRRPPSAYSTTKIAHPSTVPAPGRAALAG